MIQDRVGFSCLGDHSRTSIPSTIRINSEVARDPEEPTREPLVAAEALEELGGAKSPDWDTAMLDALDAEIREVFGEDLMITPDDIRHQGQTLEESVLQHGWPRVADTRGQVMFLMDNDDQEIQDAYRAGGRESLQGRVLFTDAEPGRADAAFVNPGEYG